MTDISSTSSITSQIHAVAALLHPTTNASAIESAAATSSLADAVSVTLSSTKFTNDLEKHINDVHAGVGELSSQVDDTLNHFDSRNSSVLSQNNPSLLKSYLSYSTAFSGYDSHARYINGVTGGTDAFVKIQDAQKNGAELKKQLDTLVDDAKKLQK